MKHSLFSAPLASREVARPSSPAARRLAAGALLAALAAAGLLAGCNYSQPTPVEQTAPAPKRVVLDYRNGWYHKASGYETVSAIASRYKRDGEMIAELNRTGGVGAVPPAGTMLYIPPTNSRDRVRDVLMALQGRPDLIPKTPWNPETNSPAATSQTQAQTASASPAPAPAATPAPTPAAVKPTPIPTPSPTPAVTMVAARPTPVFTPALTPPSSAAAQGKPSNPLPGKSYQAAQLASPAPGRTEVVLAEPKPAEKHGLFGWFGRGHSGSAKAAPAPTPLPQATPVPAPASSSQFVWPVAGKIVTPYRVGWHKACHGIEIGAAEGSPVHAARSGRVLLARDFPGYGNLILIDHGDGYATAYGYNRQMVVREGQQVQRGQTIGSVGRPSQGSAPRLLFQVRRNSLPVDPMPLLKKS